MISSFSLRSTTAHQRVLAAIALCTAAVPMTVAAAVSFPGDGAYDTLPLYRSVVLGGIDRDADGSFAPGDIFGIDHVSNTAARDLVNFSDSISANGAAMSFSGWSAYSGALAARTFATMSVSNADVNDHYYVAAGQGTATTVVFLAAPTDAQATFTFKITGTDNNPTGIGTTTSSLRFAATTDPALRWPDRDDPALNPLVAAGAGSFSYTLSSVPIGVPISLFFWTSAYAEVHGGSFAQGSDFTLTADYGNTIVLDEVQLLDGAGAPVEFWVLAETAAGLPLSTPLFDQTGRLAAVAPPPMIPEPSSYALMLAGLVAVAAVVRRRRNGRA